MFAKKTVAIPFSILASAVSAIHLGCALKPDAQCDPAEYCKFTWNNGNCISPGWGQNDQVPTFQECIIDITCKDKCVNGLCCDTSKLPNGEADCPTFETLTGCCFVRNPSTFAGNWVPPVMDRPPELSCGC